MKKKIVLIIIMLLIICGCRKKEKETEKEIVTHTDDEITMKLIEYGNELYEKKEYLKYKKDGEKYSMSLNDLSELGYDIEYFIDENKKACDKQYTKIYFDPNHSIIPKEENTNPIYVVFYNCTKSDYSTNEMVDK